MPFDMQQLPSEAGEAVASPGTNVNSKGLAQGRSRYSCHLFWYHLEHPATLKTP